MRKELEEVLIKRASEYKKALFDGPEWQSWMMRKDVVDPANMQHLRSQDNGYLTSFLASTALGGGLGYLGSKLNGEKHSGSSTLGGAITGGGLAMLANLVGKGAGYVTPTRTKAQHDKYQNGGTAVEWLIPGVANYNKVKTYGYSLHGREKDQETKAKQEDEQKKAASLEKKAEPVVAPSNVYFNTAADMALEQPKSQKRVLMGGGIGLLAGLLAGGMGAAAHNDAGLIPLGAIGGFGLGTAGMGIYEGLRLANKQKELVNKYRAAEAAQSGKVPQEKAAAVDKKTAVLNIVNKAINK